MAIEEETMVPSTMKLNAPELSIEVETVMAKAKMSWPAASKATVFGRPASADYYQIQRLTDQIQQPTDQVQMLMGRLAGLLLYAFAVAPGELIDSGDRL